MDTSRLCLRCMRDTAGFEVCMHCGFVNNEAAAPSFLLKPGTTLRHGRYYTGTANRITPHDIWYAGYDLASNSRVYIRELFPDALVTRDAGSSSVIPKDESCGAPLHAACVRYLAVFRAVMSVSCRNIIFVYDIFEENSTVYAVTEFLEGLLLTDFLAKNPAKPAVSAAQNVSLQLCMGLAALHSAGYVHAGLSTDSVFMGDNGSIKLVSFHNMLLGKSTSALFLPELSSATTPPEVYSGLTPTPESDIYSLGALIYRMFSGYFPHPANKRANDGGYLPLTHISSGASPAAALAVDKALSLEPTGRFFDVHAFVAAFTGIKPVETTLDMSRKKANRKAAARRALAIGGCALLMLMGAALITLYFLLPAGNGGASILFSTPAGITNEL